MIPPVVSALMGLLVSLFQSCRALHLKILALQHQVAVYPQLVSRLHLHPTDRLLWAWLSRLWSGRQEALVLVQPRPVIAWQRKRCRDHWRRLSQRGKPGRPTITQEARNLIRHTSQANPTWGVPWIVGELRKLGIDIAKSMVEKYRVRPRKPPSPMWKVVLNNMGYYHCYRTHLSLSIDGPEPRPVHPPTRGSVIAVPEVGGRHHHGERRAA